MHTGKKNRGFTLIELVVVIAILAILAAFALPRFAQLSEQAHESNIRATAGALTAGAALVKAQWVSNGHGAAVVNLQGFGENNIDVSDEGWPVGTGLADAAAASGAETMGAPRCQQVWEGLLQSNAPTINQTANSADYQATVNSGDCRFVYQPDGLASYIQYDANTGEVTVTINP